MFKWAGAVYDLVDGLQVSCPASRWVELLAALNEGSPVDSNSHQRLYRQKKFKHFESKFSIKQVLCVCHAYGHPSDNKVPPCFLLSSPHLVSISVHCLDSPSTCAVKLRPPTQATRTGPSNDGMAKGPSASGALPPSRWCGTPRVPASSDLWTYECDTSITQTRNVSGLVSDSGLFRR